MFCDRNSRCPESPYGLDPHKGNGDSCEKCGCVFYIEKGGKYLRKKNKTKSRTKCKRMRSKKHRRTRRK